MIVFIGHPAAAAGADGIRPAGSTALAALEAAAAGAAVQLVGKVGDDDAGDAVILGLAAGGVGHVALLRDPARPTPVVAGPPEGEDLADDEVPPRAVQPADPDARPALEAADVELGLRYLADFRAIVVAEPLSDAIVRVVADSAAYAGAELVVVTAGEAPGDVPASAVVLAVPTADPEGAFASLLGRLGAAIETGQSAGEALASVASGVGAVRSE